MDAFRLWSFVAALVVVVVAFAFRGRIYGVFRIITLSVHVLIASAIAPRFVEIFPLFLYLHACVFVQSLVLVRPRMRPLLYRVLVSIPGAFFSAGTLLSLPWAIASGFGVNVPGIWLPFAFAAIGLVQSLTSRKGTVPVVVADGNAGESLKRLVASNLAARVTRPLRVVQLTDTHLGPFMSVARLRRICERAVSQNPDLICLTGDFLTMESQNDPALLGAALAPLRALEGRVFACLGNHDHEAPEVVRNALSEAGVRLLVDEAVEVDTEAGNVQIVGMDYRFRGRREHLREVCSKHPRKPSTLRIVLLHDPGAFRHLPHGEADLVLSGHTHGGQVGLVSLGLSWTMMRVLMNAPDHGLWARGTDRLYVHRGTGHYGFPLRLGVPAEESLLEIHAARLERAALPGE